MHTWSTLTIINRSCPAAVDVTRECIVFFCSVLDAEVLCPIEDIKNPLCCCIASLDKSWIWRLYLWHIVCPTLCLWDRSNDATRLRYSEESTFCVPSYMVSFSFMTIGVATSLQLDVLTLFKRSSQYFSWLMNISPYDYFTWTPRKYLIKPKSDISKSS